MAWISTENLGLYHQKLKDWIASNIHANKVIQDESNKFVSSIQIKNWDSKIGKVVQFEAELPATYSVISIDQSLKINDTSVVWLFVDGVKQIKGKHFKINAEINSLVLIEPYQNPTDIEVIIFE